ncbi:hypothetical protein BH20ACT5_BH20ACT5_08250 [soil metagenome]
MRAARTGQEEARTERLTVSVPADLARTIRAAAAEDAVSVSRWVVDSVEDRLLLRRMRDYLAGYEAEFGEITDEEIARTRRELDDRSRPWR